MDDGRSQVSNEPPIKAQHADLGEIRLHHKTSGTGVPIVFLHGGSSTSDAWDDYLPRFAESYRAIALDSRGQGQSTLGNGPITYGRMAGDVVRLLDHLGIDRAHVVGHSDGGVIALHLLIDYPDRVRSATLLGTPFHIDNYPANTGKVLEDYVKALAASDPAYDSIKSKHAAASNPRAWALLVNRLGQMWRTQPTFSQAEIGLIDTPVLIVKTDHDFFIPTAVFDRMAMLIQGARVLHLAEGTHSVYRQKLEEVSAAIGAFVQEVDNAR
jgi:pimeloyl-ACP methyl ester carboxylesterase